MQIASMRTIDIPATSAPRNSVLMQLWRRKTLFVLTFCSIMFAVAITIMLLPIRYTASGSVILAQQEPLTGNSDAAWVQKLGDPADLESHLLLMRSPRLLRAVLGRPGVVDAIGRECEAVNRQSKLGGLVSLFESGRACTKLVADTNAMMDWIEPRYGWGSVGRSRVIAVSYNSPRADIAQTMANALIAAYLEDELTQKLESRSAAASWLHQELDQIGNDLHKEDVQIQAYRRTHGLIRGEVAPISSEQLTAAGRLLAAAEAARADAGAKLQELAGGRGAADVHAVLDNLTITQLKQQLATVAGQLANAQALYGHNHPTVTSLQRQADDIQAHIDRETQAIANSAQRAYSAANSQVTGLTHQLESLKQDVGSATDNEAAISSMVRDAEIKRELYVDLYKKASEMETERRVMTGDTHLVGYAELPSLPSFPKKTPFAAAGFVLSLIVATAAALLRDRADRSVRAAGGVEVLTGLPVLVQIPAAGRSALPLGEALRLVQNPSALQETIRSLHAQIALAGRSERLRTLLVTSSGPREGKTFTTLALAHFAAASGRRVLVVECDLRCPSFQTGIRVQTELGLADYLAGRASFDDVLSHSEQPGLDVIVAGRPHLQSTELLASPLFARLMERASTYDLVLLDSPPSELLMDARLLSRHVDGVLYCARWAQSELDWVAGGVRGIQEAGGRVVGLAVTMVREREVRLYDTRPLRQQPYLLAN